jgi:uncharacterized RmlC-like cupin family protein
LERPQIVTRHDLENPSVEQSAGMQRGQAFAHKGVWAGYSVFPGGSATGWHHHGDYATYAYVTEGRIKLEYGMGGSDVAEASVGDFLFIPPRMIHRESVAPEGGAGVVVRTGGRGPTVFNVEGPLTAS